MAVRVQTWRLKSPFHFTVMGAEGGGTGQKGRLGMASVPTDLHA